MKEKARFSEDANTHYRFSSAKELAGDIEALSGMIKHHSENQVPRLEELTDYYRGNNRTILRAKRRKEDHNADHRAVHNFAKYISQFIQGYMVGVPLKTSYTEGATNDKLREINRTNDADEHNSDLVLDLSIYGRAYELLYRNQRDETRFTLSDVKETFVVYDMTVEMNPIAAVRYIKHKFKDEKVTVKLYTEETIYTYEINSVTDVEYGDPEEEVNFFKGIPIVEYENNKFRQGDFEDVLNSIDLYDEAQSDTANYMTDFNDAMLKITGDVELEPEQAQQMKEKNIIMLKPATNGEGQESKVDAGYLVKQYDVSGTEAYKTRLANDILLITTIPNLLDTSFSGTQTGEALKMKLFGLSQMRATKERMFKKSLRDRYRLISNLAEIASEGTFDVNKISITFTENLPRSIEKELDWFAKLGGQLSQETLLSLLSFVENPQEEMAKLEREQPKRDEYDFEQVDES